MIGFSDKAKQRIKDGKIIKAYMKFPATDTEEELIINEDNYLKEFTFTDERYVPDEGFLGQAVAKEITGKFYNINTDFNVQDREFELYIGVELEDETTEYQKYGTFIVQKPESETTTDNTSFTALDYMVKFNQEYIDRITYPCTLKELLYDICDQANVETNIDSFYNSNFIITNNQFEEGATLREILKSISQIAFNWARINEYDELVMDFDKNIDITETLDSDKYYTLSTQKDYGELNVIIFKDSQVEGENVTIRDEKSIKNYGEIEYSIIDNPFAYTQNKRFKLIEMGRKLFRLQYSPITIKDIGLIYLNCQDKIKSIDIANKEYESYVLNISFTYNGVISEHTIESPAQTITETKYQYNSAEKQAQRRTEILVDKANQEIESIVENITSQLEAIVEIKQNIEGIQASIVKINNLVKEVEGNTILELEDCKEGNLLTLHIYGNNTVFQNTLYPANDLYPSDTLFSKGSARLKVSTNILLPNNTLYPADDLYPEIGEEHIINLKVPSVLRQFNSEIYDEYVLEDGTAYIIRRVGIEDDGTLYVLPIEEKEIIGEITISLSEGTNYISLLPDNEAIMKATFATRTSLTDTFAKVVELQNVIKATDDEISMTVSKLVDKTIESSKYTQTKDTITLEATNINLKGNINFTTGEILYQNSSGTTGTIVLSKSVIDFSYIDIVYSKGNNGYATQRIDTPDGKKVNLTLTEGIVTDYIALYSATISISEKTITFINGKTISFTSGGSLGGFSQNNQLLIYKIIGYK